MCRLINFNRSIRDITQRTGEQNMSYNLDQQTNKTARVRRLFVTALVFVCAFGAATYAAAQTVTPPPTPTAITPPAGNTAYAVGHAFGSQGYVCLPDQMRRGRVPSIAARCGQRCRRRRRTTRSSPAPTRVARTLVRFPASYCSQSETNRGQRAVNSWPKLPSYSA